MKWNDTKCKKNTLRELIIAEIKLKSLQITLCHNYVEASFPAESVCAAYEPISRSRVIHPPSRSRV